MNAPVHVAVARAREDRESTARIGRTLGGWHVEARIGREGGSWIYRTRCTSCDAIEEHTGAELDAGPVCLGCLAGAPDDLEEHQAEALARLASVPRLDAARPWADDVDARAWLAEHPDGSTLEEVGRAFRIGAVRVQQIEAAALRKVRAELERGGFGADDVAAATCGTTAG